MEIILNHYTSLDNKLEYYKRAYDEELKLKANKEIEILAIAELPEDLIGIFADFNKQLMKKALKTLEEKLTKNEADI